MEKWSIFHLLPTNQHFNNMQDFFGSNYPFNVLTLWDFAPRLLNWIEPNLPEFPRYLLISLQIISLKNLKLSFVQQKYRNARHVSLFLCKMSKNQVIYRLSKLTLNMMIKSATIKMLVDFISCLSTRQYFWNSFQWMTATF